MLSTVGIMDIMIAYNDNDICKFIHIRIKWVNDKNILILEISNINMKKYICNKKDMLKDLKVTIVREAR